MQDSHNSYYRNLARSATQIKSLSCRLSFGCRCFMVLFLLSDLPSIAAGRGQLVARATWR